MSEDLKAIVKTLEGYHYYACDCNPLLENEPSTGHACTCPIHMEATRRWENSGGRAIEDSKDEAVIKRISEVQSVLNTLKGSLLHTQEILETCGGNTKNPSLVLEFARKIAGILTTTKFYEEELKVLEDSLSSEASEDSTIAEKASSDGFDSDEFVQSLKKLLAEYGPGGSIYAVSTKGMLPSQDESSLLMVSFADSHQKSWSLGEEIVTHLPE